MAVQDSCVSPMHTIHEPNKQVFVNLTQSKELASSEADLLIRVRKPYTISKQREKWTEEEHEKFLEAIKLHGRSWCRIQEHVGTKTTIQIRSHAQKFFSKVVVDREPNTGNSIEIPPPRPKRKPLHPYPRKLGHLYTIQIPDRKELEKSSPIPTLSKQESGSPISVLPLVGSDASGSSFINPSNGSISPSSSSFTGSDQVNMLPSELENGYCSPTSSNVGDYKVLSLGLVSNTSTKLDESALDLGLDSKDHTSRREGLLVEAQPTSVKLFGRTVYITNSEKKRPFDDENTAAQCFKSVPSAEVCPHEEKTEQSPAHEALCGFPSRISCNEAASSIDYYLLVPNDVQMGSKSEMFAPVPFLRSFEGSLPFTSTNINMASRQYKPQTRLGDPIQAQKEDSSSGSSSCSSSNNIIINDGNHSAVSHEGSGLQHERLCFFKLKRSENSAFSRVKKASTGRSARGFSPYRRNGDS